MQAKGSVHSKIGVCFTGRKNKIIGQQTEQRLKQESEQNYFPEPP